MCYSSATRLCSASTGRRSRAHTRPIRDYGTRVPPPSLEGYAYFLKRVAPKTQRFAHQGIIWSLLQADVWRRLVNSKTIPRNDSSENWATEHRLEGVWTLLGTLDGYEVEELTTAQAAHLLRERNSMRRFSQDKRETCSRPSSRRRVEAANDLRIEDFALDLAIFQ